MIKLILEGVARWVSPHIAKMLISRGFAQEVPKAVIKNQTPIKTLEGLPNSMIKRVRERGPGWRAPEKSPLKAKTSSGGTGQKVSAAERNKARAAERARARAERAKMQQEKTTKTKTRTEREKEIKRKTPITQAETKTRKKFHEKQGEKLRGHLRQTREPDIPQSRGEGATTLRVDQLIKRRKGGKVLEGEALVASSYTKI